MSLGNPTHPLGTMLHSGLLANVRGQVSTLFVVGSADSVEIVLRRGNAMLDPQLCRLTTPTSTQIAQSDGAEQAESDIVVIGRPDMDIKQGDRFNTVDGTLIEVEMIRPIRTIHTVAFGKAIQR